jgi:hypothetical protein
MKMTQVHLSQHSEVAPSQNQRSLKGPHSFKWVEDEVNFKIGKVVC